ncbi:hypothetical protein HD806DRAFT_492495 [Xylariaceae sp. AK1471]|nr:hypothetical protein HD806DRAFT_492495 [Xylariaceae sp. AK1471]
MAAPNLQPHYREKTRRLGGRLLELAATIAQSDPGASWWWWWEIIAAIVSLSSNLLIIVLLIKIDQSPLKFWILPIQPSSLLSVLTTISKTSLLVSITSCISQLKWRHFSLRPRPLSQLQLFDDASRGPWGSLVMMSKFIFQRRVLALVATGLAVCNVLALGIDPSAQQLIGLALKEVQIANDTVLASRAGALYSRTSYDIGKGLNYSQAFPGMTPYTNAERTKQALKLEALVYSTMVGSAPQPFYNCPEPALRCTWDDFSTLGICANFRNITDAVTQSCPIISADYRESVGYEAICNFSCHGISIHYSDRIKTISPVSLKFILDDDSASFGGGSVFNSSRISTTASLGSLWMVRVGDFDQSFNGTLYTAFESSIVDFYYCSREFYGVTASTEGFRVASTNTTPWSYADGSREYADIEGYTNYDTIVPYMYNTNGETRYNISVATGIAISEVLDSLVGSPVYWRSGVGVEEYPEYYGKIPEAGDSPTKVKVGKFLYANDVEAFSHNLADALSAFMTTPNGDNINATTVFGYMVFTETHFEVQWLWLSVLIFESLLATVLLVVTILLSRGQPLIKNSVIALLVYTLSGWRDEELRVSNPETPEKWEELAEGMVAQFSKDGRGKHRFNRVLEDS